MRIINRKQVGSLLPMGKAIDLMREGFGALSAGRVIMPPRGRIVTPDGDMLLKPACITGRGLHVKLVLTYPGNPAKGLASVLGLMMVFDDRTGQPLAVMDAGELTAIRTGAAGGLAVDLLSRRDSRAVALIGAGVQSRTQLLAAMEVRPIERVFLYDPKAQAAESLKAWLAAHAPKLIVTLVDEADMGVAQADIVLTATTSPVPTFSGSAVRPGTHINAVGAYQPDRREIDDQTARMAYVVVDHFEAAGAEAGDLLMAGVQADAELGQIVNGDAPGRSDDRQVTLFKSVGVAVQDAVSAAYILDEAERGDIGVVVDMTGD